MNNRNIHKKAKPLRWTDRMKDIWSDGVDFISIKREPFLIFLETLTLQTDRWKLRHRNGRTKLIL